MAIDPNTAFVSYSRGDLEFARRLASDLKAKGAKVWMDKLDIRPGQRWEAQVEVAVGACSRMLVILSPAAIASSNVLAEAALAIDEGKDVIPVLYQQCKIPFRLRPFQYADFRTEYATGIEELLASLSGELRKNMPDSRKPIGDSDGRPWPANFVRFSSCPLDFASQLQRVIDSAIDESPIRKWFEENPAALVSHLSATCGWLFSRPKLGAEFVPDFMFCSWDSRGYRWSLVELENPNFASLTGEGSQTAVLTNAVRQILDWRIWLRANVQYAQHELGFRDLDDGFRAHIVIGRRKNMDERERLRYRELSRDGLEVLTYDRLVESLAKSLRLST